MIKVITSRTVAACFLVALVAALLTPITDVTHAAVITVTMTADGVAADGACTLREAVISANIDQAVGGCAAGSGADVIAFDPALPRPATFLLTTAGAGEDASLTGDLDVTGVLTVNGDSAAQLVVDGNSIDRVFEVRPGAALMLTASVQSGVANGAGGGGILVDATSALTLTNAAIRANTATIGGGLLVLGSVKAIGSSLSGNDGGGLAIDGGEASLTDVTIAGNTGGAGLLNRNQASLDFDGGEVSGNSGGGIANEGSKATLAHLLIANNGGSGVNNTGPVYTSLTMSLSSVTGNHAAQGGGLNNSGVGAVASVTTTSFTANSATGAGGGIYNNAALGVSRSLLASNHARTGGGIDHAGGNLDLVNDTISGNTAADNGGGLYNRSSANMTNVTFYHNTAGGTDTGAEIFNDTASLALTNTLIEGGADNCTNSEGVVNSLGHNLETGHSCGLTAQGDLVNTSGLLQPLRDNGGPTWTHALRTDSPAIDAADLGACPKTDQRGVIRPYGSGCDIGAFELAGYLPGSRRYLPLLLR